MLGVEGVQYVFMGEKLNVHKDTLKMIIFEKGTAHLTRDLASSAPYQGVRAVVKVGGNGQERSSSKTFIPVPVRHLAQETILSYFQEILNLFFFFCNL